MQNIGRYIKRQSLFVYAKPSCELQFAAICKYYPMSWNIDFGNNTLALSPNQLSTSEQDTVL